jgi:glycosyltransferase involved in cell wall biosynthesis
MADEALDRKLRILTLCYEFPPLGGGGSKVAHGLAKQLVGERHTVELVTTRYAGHAGSETVDGIHVHRVPAWRRRADRTNSFELATYILPALWRSWRLNRRFQPDVVHAHFILPDGITCWLLSLLTGRRYIITAHGSDVPGYNPDRFQLAHVLLRPLWRRVIERADAVICPSPWLSELLRQQSPQSVRHVIPNGFDPARFAPAAANGPKPGPEADDRVELLCVSRLMERKGIQHLLRAVAKLERAPLVRIVGVGPYEDALRRLAADLDIEVVFHGWIDNQAPALAALFDRADIFALPSSTENFPVSLLEAMSARLAILTTADTGCQDVVGDAAMLTPYGDVDGLAAALARLMDEPDYRRSLGARGRQRLLDHFTWSVVAAQYAALYGRYATRPHAIGTTALVTGKQLAERR